MKEAKAFQYNADIIDLAPDDWIAIVSAIELLAELKKGRSIDDASRPQSLVSMRVLIVIVIVVVVVVARQCRLRSRYEPSANRMWCESHSRGPYLAVSAA